MKTTFLMLVILSILGGCAHFPIGSETENAIEADPIKLARSLAEKGAVRPALEVLRKAAMANPLDHTLKAELAWLYYKSEEYERAHESFAGLLASGHRSCFILTGAGVSLIKLNEHAKAVLVFEECLALESSNKEARNGLAFAATWIGNYKRAQQLYFKLILDEPENLHYRSNYAVSLILDGKYRAAVQELSGWISHPRSTTQHRQNLAFSYAMLGNWSAARSMSERDLPPSLVEQNMSFYRYLHRSGNRGEVRSALLAQ
ncbi:tetratricopeptide repeat protein [Sneathiella glossodoripedis]|uniref:tetratricopeptide repeat protein n=1 Tax=Sneathiella glossodoripedis TaxID=418853 RepID=UPI000472158B|nr:tetratricopeptide repeat protein [Sneathiella glossodoripedis]